MFKVGMNKIKDFLMIFSIILILFSVLVGLGVLLAEAIIWIAKLFPEKYEDVAFFGTFFVIVSALVSLILLKENE